MWKRPFGGFDSSASSELSHQIHHFCCLSLSRCLSSELAEESKAKAFPLPTSSTPPHSHLSMLLSFFCSSLGFAFHGNRLHQSYRILQNTTVLRVVFFWYDSLLLHIGAEKCATQGFWCFLCSNCRLHSGVCTCNLSWELK